MAILTNEDVAAKVRGAAAERRASNAAIADALSMSSMAISRRMRGETPFSPEELSRLSVLLNKPVGAFFGEVAA